MNKYFDNFYYWWKNIDKFLLFNFRLVLIGPFFSLVSTSLIASDKLDRNHFISSLNILYNTCIYYSDHIFIFKSKILTKYSLVLFLIAFLSLFLVPFIGIEVKGSKRWLNLLFT